MCTVLGSVSHVPGNGEFFAASRVEMAQDRRIIVALFSILLLFLSLVNKGTI